MRAEQENWGNTVKERLFDQRGAVVVHWLILLNVVIFFLGFFFQVEVPRDIYPPGRLDLVQLYGAYSEYMCFHEGELWRLFTYQFLHANLGHILFNMIALWFFGPVVEERFGHLRFLLYYLFCGLRLCFPPCWVIWAFLTRNGALSRWWALPAPFTASWPPAPCFSPMHGSSFCSPP